MSSTAKRSTAGWDPQTRAPAGVLVLVALIVGPVTLALHLGNRLDGSRQHLPANPAELVIGLFRGTISWPGPATGILATLAVAVLALAVTATVRLARARRRRSRVDAAARHMAAAATSSTPPGTRGLPAARSGCSTRRASSTRNPAGGGTRSATSPTR